MSDNATFSLLDTQFFVPVDRKTPGPEYLSVVAGLGSAGWRVAPGGLWTHVVPPGWASLNQGWKLHVSATPANGSAVLARIVNVLQADPAAFKFASDTAILYVMNSKNWPREGGGKFVTIYPLDDEHFRRLSRALAEATEGLEGPYILSDRRVPGSRIVFYRYGEHRAAESVDVWGQRVQQIVSPSGERIPDRRKSFFHLPDWVQDPHGGHPIHEVESDGRRVRLSDRYEVHGALSYSNLGGVYRGRDLVLDQPVVIRERRPCTGWIDADTDSVALLHKEGRILRLMGDTGWAPRWVDEFPVWEHHYLVMEEVKGISLRDDAMSRYLGRRRIGSPRYLFRKFRTVILQLVDAIEAFHGCGVILRDLTAGNVLVRRDGSICIIDFEYSWERGGEQPFAPRIHTPGSASPEQMAGRLPTEADDYHALGAIIVELCSMMAPGLELNGAGVMQMAGMMMDEVGLPRVLLKIAEGLLAVDPSARWGADSVREALAQVPASAVAWKGIELGSNGSPALAAPAEQALAREISETCTGLCGFFDASAAPDHGGTLWPASPDAYNTNGASIQFGACGPIEFVRRVQGTCPAAWLDWLEQAAVPERCPPGMYVGLAGISMTLAGAGRTMAAGRLLRTAAASPLLADHPGLYQGAAGVGTVALALAADLDDPELDKLAVRLGEVLAGRARRRARGLAWPVAKVIPSGLGAGASGIALFYTYLGARTAETYYWDLARQALEYEFAQVQWRGGYAFWPSTAWPKKKFRSPHVFFGSAGVATAAARLYACTGDPEMRRWAELAANTLTFRWTNKLWQDFGYAGWGDTLLDMATATGAPEYRQHALRMAEVLLAGRVNTRFGTAFPGGALNRVSADFGMGAAGIGLFLHRMATPDVTRAFYPDHLLPRWGTSGPPLERAPEPLASTG